MRIFPISPFVKTGSQRTQARSGGVFVWQSGNRLLPIDEHPLRHSAHFFRRKNGLFHAENHCWGNGAGVLSHINGEHTMRLVREGFFRGFFMCFLMCFLCFLLFGNVVEIPSFFECFFHRFPPIFWIQIEILQVFLKFTYVKIFHYYLTILTRSVPMWTSAFSPNLWRKNSPK